MIAFSPKWPSAYSVRASSGERSMRNGLASRRRSSALSRTRWHFKLMVLGYADQGQAYRPQRPKIMSVSKLRTWFGMRPKTTLARCRQSAFTRCETGQPDELSSRQQLVQAPHH